MDLAILVVDDEVEMRDACRQALQRGGCTVHGVGSGVAALRALAERRFDVVLLDLKMPGTEGMKVLSRIRARHPEAAVVVITGFATVEAAVEAMRAGAVDFVTKPITPVALRMTVERAAAGQLRARENVRLKRVLRGRDGSRRIIGKTPQIQAIFDLIRRVAPSDSTVLITGESGTGKELIARTIHEHSQRAGGPFVVVDCSTLVGALFESELFGHVKGSFTGATATTHGRVELAGGGTLFLDEVGDIDLNLQGKLLRLLQEREFTRVGSNQVISVDVRIVAATNADLMEAISAGRFREDLFYRLSVVPIVLPPLRARRDDIPALAEHFLGVHSRRRSRRVAAIGRAAIELLMEHDWPGNVRELENVIERAVVLTEGDQIVPSDLLYYAGQPAHRPGRSGEAGVVGTDLTLADVERLHIQRVLSQEDGNRARTARRLGVDRKTLWRKLKKFRQNAPPSGG